MTKETRLNLRISDELREEIEILAAYHGLKMSSYAHSLIVKAVRREKAAEPEAFMNRGVKAVSLTEDRQLAPVVSHPESRKVVQRMIDDDEHAEAKRRTTPKRKAG